MNTRNWHIEYRNEKGGEVSHSVLYKMEESTVDALITEQLLTAPYEVQEMLVFDISSFASYDDATRNGYNPTCLLGATRTDIEKQKLDNLSSASVKLWARKIKALSEDDTLNIYEQCEYGSIANSLFEVKGEKYQLRKNLDKFEIFSQLAFLLKWMNDPTAKVGFHTSAIDAVENAIYLLLMA